MDRAKSRPLKEENWYVQPCVWVRVQLYECVYEYEYECVYECVYDYVQREGSSGFLYGQL